MEFSLKENVHILVSLLKEYQIKHIVLSPGNRDVPLVHMVENDSAFTCYSVVDERSAAFFAVGLIERLGCPVAICCTSGTAMCNYISAVSEAYYQRLPLLVLTADRPHQFLNQNEDQMIPQAELLKSVTKRSVQLACISTEQDQWYCISQVHSALLELEHHGKGPVHINFEVYDRATSITDGFVGKTTGFGKINRYEIGKQQKWQECLLKLNTSDIMIVYGQCGGVSGKAIKELDRLSKRFDCVIAKDHLANIHCDNAINIYAALNILSEAELEQLFPDIIITMQGNSVLFQPLKAAIAKRKGNTEQWLVEEDGELRNSLRCLTAIFECSAEEFIEYFANCEIGETLTNNDYAARWKKAIANIALPKPAYSSLYAVKKLTEALPENCILHIGNSSSVRYANFFPLDKSITVYCNRGTNGIDGSFSSFMGNAAVSNQLCFLLIGDLSFFYDLNACWNRYCGNNIRILLNNNEGAELFHYSYGERISEITYVSADHDATAKGWVESRGFKYLSAHNQEEFDENFECFMSASSEQPIVFEVFSPKDIDAKAAHEYYESNMSMDIKRETKKIVKKMMGKSKSLDTIINKVKKN